MATDKKAPVLLHKLGDRVLVRGKDVGTIKWIGLVDITVDERTFYGVEFDNPVGKFDGSVTTKGGSRHKRYYTCKANHGDFVLPEFVKAYQEEERAATLIQSNFRGMVTRQMLREEMNQRVWNILDNEKESQAMHARVIYDQLRKNYMKSGYKDVFVRKEAKKDSKDSSGSASSGDSLPNASPANVRMDSTMWGGNEIGEPPKFKDPITIHFVIHMMDHFRRGGLMEREDIEKLINGAVKVLEKSPSIVVLPKVPKITVVGDVHGQLDDVFYIFNHNGMPNDSNPYLFNGDFVDRGHSGLEIVLILLAFKLLYPRSFHMNRGNHESVDMNSVPGMFLEEVLEKYPEHGREVFHLVATAFSRLPLAHIIQDDVFVVHGGVSTLQLDLKELAKLDPKLRFALDQNEPTFPREFIEMMWNDPMEIPGRLPSPRGAGYLYGPDYTEQFLKMNKISYVLRSHECRDELHDLGYLELHAGKNITVFSASNYCGTSGNLGSWAIVRPEEPPEMVSFYADASDMFCPHRAHRNDVIEEDIICQLAERIAEKRKALGDWYQKLDPKKTSEVTRHQLQQGLRELLNMPKIPFLYYAEGLDVPGRKFEDNNDATVNYVEWLGRFRTVHPVFSPRMALKTGKRTRSSGRAFQFGVGDVQKTISEEKSGSPLASPSNKEPTTITIPLNNVMTSDSKDQKTDVKPPTQEEMDEEITTQFLYENRERLEQLFRQFDVQQSGQVSEAEFENAITALNKIQAHPLSPAQIKQILSYFNSLEEGERKYLEMFRGFELENPNLRAHFEKRVALLAQVKQDRQEKKKASVSSEPPIMTTKAGSMPALNTNSLEQGNTSGLKINTGTQSSNSVGSGHTTTFHPIPRVLSSPHNRTNTAEQQSGANEAKSSSFGFGATNESKTTASASTGSDNAKSDSKDGKPQQQAVNGNASSTTSNITVTTEYKAKFDDSNTVAGLPLPPLLRTSSHSTNSSTSGLSSPTNSSSSSLVLASPHKPPLVPKSLSQQGGGSQPESPKATSGSLMHLRIQRQQSGEAQQQQGSPSKQQQHQKGHSPPSSPHTKNRLLPSI